MQKVLLVVMDGVGIRDETQGNAFKQANTPNIDDLFEEEGFTSLEASEEAVGLPEGFTGNSEVGHLHLGAGRTVPQRLKRINESIGKKDLEQKKALKQAFERAEKNNSTVHLAGIISDGGIHGHIDHLKALMKISDDYKVEVKIHCFTDGRDVSPKSSEKFISKVENWCEKYDCSIATLMGRYYAMDRDSNWDRTYKAYQAMAKAEGYSFSDPRQALEATYEEGDYDYFVKPSVSEDYIGMNDDDEIIFYNFRADRERQIEKLLLGEKNFNENNINPNFTGMFPYDEDIDTPSIFNKQIVENTLGEKIDEAGLKQLRVAESQKIPHVTYFFNGQRELKFENEDREFIESDKIRAYDQKPEMHADETTDIVINAMEEGEHDFILLNYANPDLVGHTGDINATIEAVETVDQNIGKLVEKSKEENYCLILTSDHGNCDDMGTEEEPKTSHTLNPVPLTGLGFEINRYDGKIAEVAQIIENILEL